MNLMRCPRGHYYDAEKFESCPHCQQLLAHEADVTVPMAAAAAHTVPLTEYKTAKLTPEPADAMSVPAAEPPASVSDLKSEIQRSVAVKPAPADVTVGYYASLIGVEPVTGWLVCVRGEYVGDSFKLKSGRNFIGRSADMDVVLSMDMQVSRSRHAAVIYEPKARRFYAQPGDSRELFYLNDQVVLGNEEMKAYDVLTLGDTRLMLIPCCSDQFCWEDLNLNKEEQ